ncbi:MAG: HD domain-containing protein [Bacteroidia bacterium]|nr:HD domain-containing protein [Bacteroidia bacterium]
MTTPPIEKTLPIPDELILKLKATEQNPRYHAEGNVYNHTLLVLQQYEMYADTFEVNPAEKEVLYWAAILHDVGKPEVTQWVDGRWSARGHEVAGVPVAREFLLGQPQLTPAQRRDILDLVRWHHVPMRWGLRDTPLDAYKRLATRINPRLLGYFAWIDTLGRICEDKAYITDILRNFNTHIVPRIHLETGDWDSICAIYQQASVRQKNALWQSLKQPDIRLLEKLLTTRHPQIHPPVFDCTILLTPASPRLDSWISTHLPDRVRYDAGAWDTPGLSTKLRAAALRMIEHFISVYGKGERKLLLTGDFTDSDTRHRIADFVRHQGGYIRYLVPESQMGSLQTETAPEDWEAIHRIWHRLEWPHPWEAHETVQVTL